MNKIILPPASRTYREKPAAQHVCVISTDDPDYLPTSSHQLDELRGLLQAVAAAMPPRTEAGAKKFQRLAAQWRAQTAFAPSVLQMATHPAYQQIIGMGPSAIPHILRELKVRPEHWFWALRAITGENPVDERDRGDLKKMRLAWLKWGLRNGYDT